MAVEGLRWILAGLGSGWLVALVVAGLALGAVGLSAADATVPALAPAPGGASASAAAAASGGYAFVPGQARLGRYDLRQETVLSTAGDRLTYVTTIGWRFVLLPLSISATRAALAVSVLHVDATLDGPATFDHIDSDSDDPAQGQDPVFGHLLALRGARLVLSVDPLTGVVDAVQGGDAIAAAVAKDAPSALGPGEPSPLEAAAKAAYSSDALARLWTAMLARPGQGDYPLGPPLDGAARRSWSGADYTLALAGADHRDATLGQAPLAVQARLSALSGKGHQGLGPDLVGTAGGTMHALIAFDALTQGAGSDLTVGWSLTIQPP
jgi:hypothetical protein